MLLNVFVFYSSPGAITADEMFTLLATICVAPRKYGAKLPDFVMKFMVVNWEMDLIEFFTEKNPIYDCSCYVSRVSEKKNSESIVVKLATENVTLNVFGIVKQYKCST